MMLMRDVVVAATMLLQGCSAGTKAMAAEEKPLESLTGVRTIPCASATRENLMDVTEHKGALISICRRDGRGDCLYTKELGKTFLEARTDLNGDGRVDFLIKDFSGAYGNHDVVHHLGYVACPNGGYVKVLDTFATRASIAVSPREGQWSTVNVSRDCFDDDSQSFVSRLYTLVWDSAAEMYGPPDGDWELLDYCTAKEMTLPEQR